MGNKKTYLGLLAIVCVWVTAGLALPCVNRLTQFTPEQLLTVRGFLTAIMALILARGKVFNVDRATLLIGACVPFAALGLFKGIRTWGASPTIIVITATPIVNFAVTAAKGKRIPRAAVIALCLILGGVIFARWGSPFRTAGLAWSLFGTVFNGILYELFSRAKAGALQRCFWGSVGIGLLGLVLSSSANWIQVQHNHELQLSLLAFAFVGGFLYWMANLIAFQNLPKDLASVLAQGETPCVILAAHFLLKEHLGAAQWFGVVMSLCGAWYLGQWLSNNRQIAHAGDRSGS